VRHSRIAHCMHSPGGVAGWMRCRSAAPRIEPALPVQAAGA
jgi:hypothetical protein